MTEEQKRIIENIHKETEDLMFEKATLTLIARQNALTGKIDNQILEQLRQIDEQILNCYREEIKKIKKYAKDLKTLAQKEYGDKRISQDKQYISYGPENDSFDLQASFAAHKLYGDITKIDQVDVTLYNELLEEMNQIQEEQNRLWNHVNTKKLSNTELEKKFRTSIKNMSKIMPTVQRKLEMEITLVTNDITNKTIKRDKFIRDVDKNIKNAHGKEDKKAELEHEKNEGANAMLEEIIELRRHLSMMKVAYEESLKNQHQMDQEAHDRREEINKKINELKERKKAIRRQANEERHQTNLQHEQESNPKKEFVQEEPIISINKPKNKKSLKEKLKKVVLVVVAASTMISGITLAGIQNRKNHNEFQNIQPTPTIVEMVEVKDGSLTPTPSPTQDLNHQSILLDEQSEINTIKQDEDKSEVVSETISDIYYETSKLWSTVTIGNKIYRDRTSAINDINPLTPYFNQEKQYTIIGVTYSKGSDNRTIYTSTINAEEQEALLKKAGYTPTEYLISTKTPEEVDFTNIENIEKYATGHVAAGDIAEYQSQNGRGR